MSMQRLPSALGGQLLVLARNQPALSPGANLKLVGPAGLAARFELHPAESLAELDDPSPAAVLAILIFIANRALGTLRARDDAELAATCHRLTTRLPLPPLAPAALCGTELGLWALPSETGQQPCFLLTPQRFVRQVSRSGQALLLEVDAKGAILLAPGGEAPGRLVPPTPATPLLAELGRQSTATAELSRAGLAELAQAARSNPRAAKQLQAMAALAQAARPRIAADPQRPVGGALEMALHDHGGGLFLRGWIRDPLKLVESVHVRSAFFEEPLGAERRHAFARPDVLKTFAQAPHGGSTSQPGFVAWLPELARLPQGQWTLRLTMHTGERLDLTSPPSILPPQQARDAILTGLPLSALTAPMLDECIVPAVQRIQAAFLAARGEPDVVRIGTPPEKPAVSVVVPLYRNLRFIRFQLSHFARDPAMRGAELIYVLDSPEQRADLENLFRALHAVYQLPVTLVVQAGNYGFASACNAGAAIARAPRLLMLNSDVIPATRGWLPVLHAALDSEPAVFAVGPKLLTEDSSVQHGGLFFERHGPLNEWFNNHYWKGAPRRFPPLERPRRVPGITGAAMLMDRARFEAVNGFSTDYAIGDYEDSDLCLKLRAAGGEILYEPRAELYHFERQSIRDHSVHDRNIATAVNRRIHELRWNEAIEALMARPEFRPVPSEVAI
jgi:O-antigen biosynthesis protein